jgi:hypothetical protein
MLDQREVKRSRASEHSRKGTDSRKGTRKGTEAEKSSERTGEEKKLDVALVHGVGPDGKSLRVLRARDDRIELGSVEPLEEGRPIHGEVIRLRPRQEFPLLCDVEVQYRPEAAESKAPARSGPPLVASESYRDNWELIWAKKRRKRELSN